MAGAPDFVGQGYLAIEAAAEAMSLILDNINPLAPILARMKTSFLNLVFNTYTGMSYTEWKAYTTTPSNHINSPTLGFASNTSTELDGLMGVAAGTSFSPSNFAAYRNATTLADLLLVKPETLDEVLFNLDVGKLYTGTRILAQINATEPPWITLPSRLALEMQRSVMHAFTRTIDGNHTWRERSKNPADGAVLKLGEGMPLWRDCLARIRAFPKLFMDSQHLNLSDPILGDQCDFLADPLPPVSISVRPLDISPQRKFCYGIAAEVTLRNHVEREQPYSLYYRISRYDLVSGSWLNVFHRVAHRHTGVELIPPRSEKQETVRYSTCQAGSYQVEVHLFERMSNLLGVTPDRNIAIALQDPYFNVPVQPKVYQIEILTDAASCPLVGGKCPEGRVPGPGGADSTRPGTGFEPIVISPPCVAPPYPCTDGPVVLAFLDADDDQVPDAGDNCPVNANKDQVNTDDLGPGDVCEPTEGVVLPFLPKWKKDGILPDERIAQFMRELLQGIGFRVPTKEPLCLTCPENIAGIKPLINSWVSEYEESRDVAKITQRIAALNRSIHSEGINIGIPKANLNPSKRTLSYSLDATNAGWLSLTLGRGANEGRVPRRITVTVDNKPVAPRLTKYHDRVHLAIPIAPGSKQSQITYR
jgi:hypothetical protein